MSQGASAGFARAPPSASQSFHSRSMFAWCSQKIGSSAAQRGSVISPPPQSSPPGPPIVPCRLLWGVNSSNPVALPKCAGAERPPPKLGSPVRAAKFVRASAAAADVAAGGSRPPAMTAALRFGAVRQSGFGRPSGRAGVRKAGGRVFAGNARS